MNKVIRKVRYKFRSGSVTSLTAATISAAQKEIAMKFATSLIVAAALATISPLTASADQATVDLPFVKGIPVGNIGCLDLTVDCRVLAGEIACVKDVMPSYTNLRGFINNNPEFPEDLSLEDCFPENTAFAI